MNKTLSIPKPKEYLVVKFKWAGKVSEKCGYLPCSRCNKPIGSESNFAVAFIKEHEEDQQQSIRLCNECGIEAESKVIK